MLRSSAKSVVAPEAALRARVEEIIGRAFGRVEEQLFESGLLDSLRAIELGTLLEAEFGIPISDMSIHDLASITSLVDKLGSHVPTTRRQMR